jgi:outer membrane protein OmpU
MKKILFATTALVATAGVASADVAISGYAEMGVIGGSGMDSQFHTDIDVTFKLSGEADNGLTFGATIDLDEEGGFGNTNGGPESVFVAYGGFKLTMGDTDGAFDAAMQEVNFGGSINDDETSHAGYNGNAGLDGDEDGQVATFAYSSGSFTGYLSVEIDDDGETAAVAATTTTVTDSGDDTHTRPATAAVAADTNGDMIIGFGIKYALGDVTIGAGTQSQGDNNINGLSVSYSANGVSAGLNWSNGEVNGNDIEHVGVGVGYSMNALTLAANYGVNTTNGVEADGFGFSAGYDMGGGLSAHLGYGSDDVRDTWSLGLAMSF